FSDRTIDPLSHYIWRNAFRPQRRIPAFGLREGSFAGILPVQLFARHFSAQVSVVGGRRISAELPVEGPQLQCLMCIPVHLHGENNVESAPTPLVLDGGEALAQASGTGEDIHNLDHGRRPRERSRADGPAMPRFRSRGSGVSS